MGQTMYGRTTKERSFVMRTKPESTGEERKFVVTSEQDVIIDKKMSGIKWKLRSKGGSSLDPEVVDRGLQSISEGYPLIREDANMVRGVFPDPEIQIALMRSWLCGYIKWDYRSLDQRIRASLPWPEIPQEPEVALILVPYMAGPIDDLRAFWFNVLKRRYGERYFRLESGCLTFVRFLHDAGIPQFTLRWERIQLSGTGVAPHNVLKVSGPRILPHAGVLAMAAYSREWGRSLLGTRTNPGVWLPGYSCNRIDQPFSSSPYKSLRMRWHKGQLCVDYVDTHADTGYVVPILLPEEGE